MKQRLKKIINKISRSTSTKGRAAPGGLWLGAGSGSEQCLRLARNMILTRVLAPEAFGLMAIVLSVNAAFESFTQIGIKEAIIQNPNGHEKAYLNGAWWLSLGRSLALYLLVFCAAPYDRHRKSHPHSPFAVGELHRVEPRVEPALCDQLVVRTELDKTAAVHHRDAIRVADRRQPVRDHDDGLAAEHACLGLLVGHVRGDGDDPDLGQFAE